MGCWRIDDLAHKAGLTVDTVRYYQRERLLPAPTRNGRHALYGPDHLERLERIRELQARRFSLAAIRSLLDADRPGLVADVFPTIPATYTLDDLLGRSGLDHAAADALQGAGVLREPVEFGREAYDAEDLDLCRAISELLDLGLPIEMITELGRIYTTGIEAMQTQVMELFANQGDTLQAVERRRFATAASDGAPQLLPLVQRMVAYVHHRTLQRLTLGAIARTHTVGDTEAPAG